MTIKEYKKLALQHAKNFAVAGQYNKVALKLQEIFDRLPAPHFKNITLNTQSVPVKTATISNEENAKIKAAWKQKTSGTKH
jgi:hypothetical protein